MPRGHYVRQKQALEPTDLMPQVAVELVSAIGPLQHVEGHCYRVSSRKIWVSVPQGDHVLNASSGKDPSGDWSLTSHSHALILRKITELMEKKVKALKCP